MKKVISIKPVEMTPEVMKTLEQKGLITRIVAGAFAKHPGYDNVIDTEIHVSDLKSGAHRFCSACTNTEYPNDFCVHSDHEEVFFIGPEDAKPLYLVMSYLSLEDFDKKAAQGTLGDDDIICIKVKFNDPGVSFFTIKKGVLHGEFVEPNSDIAPPSFFFSAGNSLTHYFPKFDDYTFDVITHVK